MEDTNGTEMDEESILIDKLKKQAVQIGLAGDKIIEYVTQGMDREERAKEREQKKLEMEMEREQNKLEMEMELRQRELELETERLRAQVDRASVAPTRERAPFPKLPLFREKDDDIDSFIFRFESHAKLCRWNQNCWPIYFASCLQGALSCSTIPFVRVERFRMMK